MKSFVDCINPELDIEVINTLTSYVNLLNRIVKDFKLESDEKIVSSFEDSIANMTEILSNCGSPDNYFKFIGNGSFKEAYELDSEGRFVIKFVGNDNNTKSELDIIAAAEEAGLDKLFAPIYAMPLNCLLPVTYLVGGNYTYESVVDSYEYHSYMRVDDEEYGLDYIMIQPRVRTVRQDENPSRYIENVTHKGKVIPVEELDKFGIESWFWLQSAIDAYGTKKFKKLKKFIKRNRLVDLRDCNIGYLTQSHSRPVILDWLSYK